MKNIFSKIACIVVLLSLIIFSIFGCDNNDNDYYLGANWNVSNERFATEYYTLYNTEIQRLSEEYNFQYLENVVFPQTTSNGKKIEIYLYACYNIVVDPLVYRMETDYENQNFKRLRNDQVCR